MSPACLVYFELGRDQRDNILYYYYEGYVNWPRSIYTKNNYLDDRGKWTGNAIINNNDY